MIPKAAILGASLLLWAPAVLLRPATETTPTYRHDVAPVFAAKCMPCHAPGGAGPFKLTTYADVRKRAALIQTVAMLHRMPPTDADSDFGKIAVHPRLSDADVVMIQNWFRACTPEGSGPVSPEPKLEKWPLGEPDLIVRSGQITVPAEGSLWTTTTSLPLPLENGAELTAFDIRPLTPSVARQALIATDTQSGDPSFTPTGVKAKNLIGGWSVGYHPWRAPEGSAVKLSPRSRLSVRMHYHPSGKAEDGGFEVGLYFAHKPAEQRPVWKTLGTSTFQIPGDPTSTVLESEYTLEQDSTILAVQPEARYAAAQVWLLARTASGFERELLHIYRWDPRWVGAYNFPEPVNLPANTTLVAKIVYDNGNHGDSSGLTFDEIKRLPPRPPIYFGPNPTDELFWMHVQMVQSKK